MYCLPNFGDRVAKKCRPHRNKCKIKLTTSRGWHFLKVKNLISTLASKSEIQREMVSMLETDLSLGIVSSTLQKPLRVSEARVWTLHVTHSLPSVKSVCLNMSWQLSHNVCVSVCIVHVCMFTIESRWTRSPFNPISIIMAYKNGGEDAWLLLSFETKKVHNTCPLAFWMARTGERCFVASKRCSYSFHQQGQTCLRQYEVLFHITQWRIRYTSEYIITCAEWS